MSVIPKGAVRPEESNPNCSSVTDKEAREHSSGRTAPFGMTAPFFRSIRLFSQGDSPQNRSAKSRTWGVFIISDVETHGIRLPSKSNHVMRELSLKSPSLVLLLTTSVFSLCPLMAWSQDAVPPIADVPAQTSTAQDVTDMGTVKTRLLTAQLVTEPKALQTLTETASKLRDTMGADGKWADLVYADTGPGEWGPSHHLDNVLVMARAYATPGQPLYHDAALQQKIDVGLDSFFAGKYLNANWWYNDIGVPIKIGPILLLLSDTISPERKEQGLALLKRSADDKPMRGSTGANLSWLARIQLMRGLAQPSPVLVAESFDAMWSEIKISPQSADGIQADYSFHQHGPLIYNGGYGMSFIGDATSFLSYARGTHFALSADKEQILVNLLLDGQDWMARGNNFDPGVRGRDITRQGEAVLPIGARRWGFWLS